jgi:leader peptidase (prepilin peptidase)/N-methyltransferase
LPWYGALPLLGHWLRRGRCRTCGKALSMRSFVTEVLTGLGFVGVFYGEVIQNLHGLNAGILGPQRLWTAELAIFGYHAILFCFLLVATMVDIDHLIIPLPLTVVGTLVGLAGSVLFPWPWPYLPAEVDLPTNHWLMAYIPQGLYAWPVWGPLPDWLAPGSRLLGLATGLAGLLAGTLALRAVRVCFGIGMGPEYMDDLDPEHRPTSLLGRIVSWFQRVGGKTMGLGDADLMMMAGAFLGWQLVMVSFFVATVPGVLFGIVQFVRKGENQLPFGPALAIGVVLTFLFWRVIGPQFQVLLFFDVLLIAIAVASGLLMIAAGFVIRLMRSETPE